MFIQRLAIAISVVFCSGCVLLEGGIVDLSGAKIEKNNFCINLKMECRSDSYQQWFNKDGSLGCACKDYWNTGLIK